MTTASTDRTICFTGMGMVSSLGHDAAAACAAARAGLTRPSELRSLSFQLSAEFGKETLDGFPAVVGHKVPGISDGFVGPVRIMMLASAALKALMLNRPLTSQEMARTGIHLNLADFFIPDVAAGHVDQAATSNGPPPSPRPSEEWKQQTSSLIQRIVARCRIAIPNEHQAVYYGGQGDVVHALNDAVRRIQEGSLDRCIVGAVDSCVEPRFLRAAASTGVLKTGDNPAGFIPGEAAAFLLLERARSRGGAAKVSGALSGTATATDPGHQFSETPPLGRGLEQALRAALAKDELAQTRAAWVIGGLNGTERRALDWGHALVRLRRDWPLAELPLWVPAVYFGETGAAAGLVAVCMAVRAFERGYAPAVRAIVWLASDNGRRGIILVDNLPH